MSDSNIPSTDHQLTESKWPNVGLQFREDADDIFAGRAVAVEQKALAEKAFFVKEHQFFAAFDKDGLASDPAADAKSKGEVGRFTHARHLLPPSQ